MGDYSIKQANELIANRKSRVDRLTKEQIEIREQKKQKLRALGVYISLYTDGSIKFPGHPDGIHNYLSDASTAIELVENDQELPQDLVDRLLYYKPIMDEQLNRR